MVDSPFFKHINVTFFWNSVVEDQRAVRHGGHLIFEKHIYLEDELESVLVLGISPHNKMSIAARIEIRANAHVFCLDKYLLTQLLDCVSTRFSENAIFPKRAHEHVNIKQLDDRFFKISLANEKIKMCATALLTLNRKQTLVKSLITRLERDIYESHLFKLLYHVMDKEPLIDDLCELECDCLQKSFVLEIATNCSDWLTACVPLFVKSLSQTQCV